MDSYAAALQECLSTSKVIVLSEGSEKSWTKRCAIVFSGKEISNILFSWQDQSDPDEELTVQDELVHEEVISISIATATLIYYFKLELIWNLLDK